MGLAPRLVALTDRAILRVAGEGSDRFLQGLCTQDVQRLSVSGPSVLPAAFLSPKGKVLCDAMVKRQDTNEYLVPSSGTQSAEMDSSDYFADPRFEGLGHRAILPASHPTSPSASLSDYHFWRVCCGVPEGPGDLKIDEVMPLHGNLDLLNFVSFSKGCYVGQELLTRTKHRGAVRRRIFTVVAMDGSDTALGRKLQEKVQSLPRSTPLTAELIHPLPRPLQGEEKDMAIFSHSGSSDPKQVGTLQTWSHNMALCMLRCEGAFNEASSFENSPLPNGVEILSASRDLRFLVRAPPYVFS
ncbi:unnamed protein product [Durusdinium trenchii]|uniref:Aminomethyltransferase folate-binding domain-containing protein n=1 Tax=Durusdinium trenchii TaxID=1381693 RepID=A0ABP0KEU9_9DINO